MRSGKIPVLAIILAAALFLTFQSFAASRTPLPFIPKALQKAEQGHAELMRRNHMNLMFHKRDQTMRKGIRTDLYSLKGCVACHAVPGPDKKPVSFESPQHFCRACHDYAAVRIDCFQCHTSKPPGGEDLATK